MYKASSDTYTTGTCLVRLINSQNWIDAQGHWQQASMSYPMSAQPTPRSALNALPASNLLHLAHTPAAQTNSDFFVNLQVPRIWPAQHTIRERIGKTGSRTNDVTLGGENIEID